MKNKQSELRRKELKKYFGDMVTIVESVNNVMEELKHTQGRATTTLDIKPKQMVMHEKGTLRGNYHNGKKNYQIIVTEI